MFNPMDIDMQKYRNFQLLQEHLRKKNKDFVCPCGKSYGSYPALYAHIKSKHGGNAPGQIIKPTPHRRRGRPFKYEPERFAIENPHKNSSKHLNYYLGNIRANSPSHFNPEIFPQRNEYPLRQMAFRQKQKQFLELEKLIKQRQQKYRKQQQRIGKYQTNGANINTSRNVALGFVEGGMDQNKSPNLPAAEQQYNSEKFSNNPFGKNMSEPIESEKMPLSHFVQNSQNNEEMSNNPSPYFRFSNNPEDFKHPDMNPNLRNYPNFGEMELMEAHRFENRFENTEIENPFYEKPFQRQLKRQMQFKFGPIKLGLIEFFQPILKELSNKQPKSANKSKQNHNSSKQIIQINDDSQEQKASSPQKKANNQTQINPQPPSLNASPQKPTLTVQSLLRHQHFKDILKWLMSPPQQLPHMRRSKQNYIQFSFRCAIVQFLDFLNNFLQTPQYQQALLFFIFFCDQILVITGSFQLRPQPPIYEMSSFFNDYIDQYIPKLLSIMKDLEGFFIFVDYRRKASQLLMWWSGWMSIQQYYHNKYYRLMVQYEIQQQHLKSLAYQQNYRKYIMQAINQNKRPQKQAQVQQKAQQNPEMTILMNQQQQQQMNKNINNHRQSFSSNHENKSYSRQSNQQIEQQEREIIDENEEDSGLNNKDDSFSEDGSNQDGQQEDYSNNNQSQELDQNLQKREKPLSNADLQKKN